MSGTSSGNGNSEEVKRAEKRKAAEMEMEEREAKQFAADQEPQSNDTVVNQTLGKDRSDVPEMEEETDVQEESGEVTITEGVDLEDTSGSASESQRPDADAIPPVVEVVTAEKLLPILVTRGYLDLESLLSCRKVCKNWKQEVDTFLENPPSRRPFSKTESQAETRRRELKALPDVSERDLEKLRGKYKFEDLETLKGFIKAYQKLEGNPFLGRTITFDTIYAAELGRNWTRDLHEPELKKYWKMVSKLLSKFGGHLKHVTLDQRNHAFGSYGISTPLHLYETLESYLTYLPNLTRLTLSGYYDRCRKTEELLDYMAGKSLPLLPNLQSLDFGFNTAAIQNAILDKSPSLTSLKSKVKLEESAECISKLALKELKLIKNRLKSNADYKILNHVQVGLEKLEFDFTTEARGPSQINSATDEMLLNKWLPVLNRFPNLCELELEGLIDNKTQTLAVKKNLTVDTLRLISCHENRCLIQSNYNWKGVIDDLFHSKGFYFWIISHFPNIRFLMIEDHMYAHNNDSNENEVNGPAVVYGSDIWTEFKALEAVSMRCRTSNDYRSDRSNYTDSCWTRDNYRKFQET